MNFESWVGYEMEYPCYKVIHIEVEGKYDDEIVDKVHEKIKEFLNELSTTSVTEGSS